MCLIWNVVDKTCQFIMGVRLSLLSAIPKHLTNGPLRPFVPILVFLWQPRVGTAPVCGSVWYDTETGVVSHHEPLSSGYSLPVHYTPWLLACYTMQLYTLMRIDYHVTRLWYTMQPRSISSSRTPRRFCGVDHRKKLACINTAHNLPYILRLRPFQLITFSSAC